MASHVYLGSHTWGQPILSIEAGRVYRGSSTWTDVIMTIDASHYTQVPALLNSLA